MNLKVIRGCASFKRRVQILPLYTVLWMALTEPSTRPYNVQQSFWADFETVRGKCCFYRMWVSFQTNGLNLAPESGYFYERTYVWMGLNCDIAAPPPSFFAAFRPLGRSSLAWSTRLQNEEKIQAAAAGQFRKKIDSAAVWEKKKNFDFD